MFRPVSPRMQVELEASLAQCGVTPEQFLKAQQLAKEAGEKMIAAYGEAIGREVTPDEWFRSVLGPESAGRLMVAALREVTGRADLYPELG